MADFVNSSITTEIIEAKDKLQQQADRAETIIDEWEGTTDLIQDAPVDNKLYGRKNGQWDEVNTSGTGDMTKAIYDPQGIDSDAFARSNHTGTQPISSVSGLNSQLNTKLEDAPSDGSEYVRKNGNWAVATGGDSVGKDEVFESVLILDGTETVLATQGDVFTLESGFYEVSAFNTRKGVMPFEGYYYLEVRDQNNTEYFDSGLTVQTAVRSLTATMIEKASIEPNSVRGVYVSQCYDSGSHANQAPTWDKVAVGSDVANVAWGDINGTLSDQTDLKNALDDKLDSDSYTASDVKTKYESNSNTNAFTDSDVSKLGGIESGAEVNKVNSIVAGDNITIDKTDPLNPVINSTGGGSTPVAADITVAATPTNYTASAQNVEAHLVGIDTALANAGGGGGGASTIPEIDFSVPQEDRVSSWRPDFVSGTNTITPSSSFINKIVELTPNGGSATDVGSVYFTDPQTCGFSAGESFYLYMNRQFTKASLADATFRFNQQDRTIVASDGSGAASLPNLFRVDYALLFATTATISPVYQWAMLKVTAWSDADWMVTIDTVIR